MEMPSIKWTLLSCTFFFVWPVAYCKEVHGFQEKNIFNRTKIVLDHQPIKNNSLTYAACNIEVDGSKMICSILLEYFPTGREIHKQVCEIEYTTSKARIADKDNFQLKLLYDVRVIFMWSERLSSDHDLRLAIYNLIFRTIDMSSCQAVETRIPYYVSPFVSISTNDFYVVPYTDTFDVFFFNNSLCGSKMCGQTHDEMGNLINGPVASFLPAAIFKKPAFVYPAKTRSPFMGHFLLSSKLYLVSSYYGKITELMDYPFGIDAMAYSYDNGLLGFCWLSRYDEHYINCTQFNGKGDKVMSIIVELEYKSGIWMNMYNLENGGILVLTSRCNDDIWCTQNVDSVAFYALEVHETGQVEQVHQIRGVDCNYVQDIKTNIIKKDNGDVCLTFACYEDRKNDGESHVNLLSKCITNK